MKKSFKWSVFLSAALISIIVSASCDIKDRSGSTNASQASSPNSATVKCPYETVTLVEYYGFKSDTSQITDKAVVDTIYNLMQPDKWEKLKDDPGNHMEALTLDFDASDPERFTYEIYNNGYLFYVHNVKSAKAEKLPDGTLVQGEYAYYQIPGDVYQNLKNYLKSKYAVNS